MVNTISLLGSTGSIGRQTLNVCREQGIQVAALTARSSIDLLEEQALKDGDVAGFGAFNGHSGLLSIEKSNGKTELVMHTNVVNMERRTKNVLGVDNEEIQRVALNSPVVMLRINADFRPGRDIARFAYSTDGKSWTNIGSDFKMRFDYQRLFMGTRFAIYNYATREKGGYVDVDYFNYERLSDDAHSLSKNDTK